MIFHKNRLLADDSHEISYLIFFEDWERCHNFFILFFLWPCSLAVPVLAGGFMLFVVLCPGTPEGSTGSCSGFKASQKTGQWLKVSYERLGEARNRTCDPWFTRHRFMSQNLSSAAVVIGALRVKLVLYSQIILK